MKYLKYLAMVVLTLLMVSFSPGKKNRETKPVSIAPFGYVQSIKSVTYHAKMDSAGNITKGDIISDTDNNVYNNRMPPHSGREGARAYKAPVFPIEIWAYNEYGDETEDAKYRANGKLYSEETHVYSETGDVREIIDSTFPYHTTIPNVQVQKYAYRYDQFGNTVISDYWDYFIGNIGNPNFKRTVNIYDSYGRQIEVLSFYSDTINPVSIVFKKYNDKGKLVETDERRRDVSGLIPVEKNDFWYDDKGRLYDKAIYHPRVGLVSDDKITFDNTGTTTITYLYGINKVLEGTVVKSFFNSTNTLQEDTYDANGRLTDYTISHFDTAKHLLDKGVFHINGYINRNSVPAPSRDDGRLDTVMVHHKVNDDHNNVVVDDYFSNTGTPTLQNSYQYTYDNVGNWISKIEFSGKTPIKITEREIEYFKE